MGDPDVDVAHEQEDRRETAGAAIQRLEAERDGWRSENDRHRALYVEAAKERDRLRAIVEDPDGVVEAMHRRLDESMSEQAVMVAERDRLRAVVDALRGFLFIEDEFDPTDDAAEVIADLRTMLAELDGEATDG